MIQALKEKKEKGNLPKVVFVVRWDTIARKYYKKYKNDYLPIQEKLPYSVKADIVKKSWRRNGFVKGRWYLVNRETYSMEMGDSVSF